MIDRMRVNHSVPSRFLIHFHGSVEEMTVMKKQLFAALLMGGALMGASVANAQDTLEWSTLANNLAGGPEGLQMHGSASLNISGQDYVYILGGNLSVSTPTGFESSVIYYAPVDSEGVLGTWAPASQELTAGNSYITRSSVGYNGRIYVVSGTSNGGEFPAYNGIRVFEADSTGNIPLGNVTEYNTDANVGEGIPAVDSPSLGLLEMSVVAKPSEDNSGDGILYIMGGANTAVRSVRIDGTSGDIVGAGPGNELGNAVTVLNALPITRQSSGFVYHEGYLYVTGGLASGNGDHVYYAEVLPNDELSAWQRTTADLPQNEPAPPTDGSMAAPIPSTEISM